MSDKIDGSQGAIESPTTSGAQDKSMNDAPADPARRRLLGGALGTGAMMALHTSGAEARGRKRATASTEAPLDVDAKLAEHIHTVVVIYAENRSFNNLFAEFPGLDQPLSRATHERYRQVDRDGKPLDKLPPIWTGMAPKEQVVNHRKYKIGEQDIVGLPNQPWQLKSPDGDPLPHGLVTRDLWHLFYLNQMQINGGKNDMFVAWGNTGAMVMGHYGQAEVSLRLWNIASRYTLCDNFFMGAFGGSFLNHQYLVAAQPPYYPNADKSIAKGLIAVTANGTATDTRIKLNPDSPASAMDGVPKFSRSSLTPDFWAVDTMGPPYAPSFADDPDNPNLTAPNGRSTMPPQKHKHIGDVLSAKGVSWAWYAGGWRAALEGKRATEPQDTLPRPNFQAHHQPLNYFESLAPGTEARTVHLRDGGVGETARTNRFLADIAAGALPSVTYYKPQGDLNMHAGYSDIESGDRHLATIVDALEKSPQWQNMLVVITFDENGGWWDHVAPPKGDRWGPGTRIPALVISPFAKRGHVDHTIYDTGSIARFLTRRFGLEKLPGLKRREEAMVAAGGPPPGDLTGALDFDSPSVKA